LTEHVWRSILRKAQDQSLIFKPIPFAISYACTEAFFRWWQDYYKRQASRVNPESLLPQLISAFDIVQNKVKKTKGTHIREIQAFQKFFQTVYDLLYPKRTVYYAARILKDKILEKIPTMKFPPFIPSKYLFSLHFKIKFASLPTSELALAFRPPYPKRFFCDSLLGMKQKLKTKEKDKVTATKCNMHTFRGHLHFNLSHIQILSPIGLGKEFSKYLKKQTVFNRNNATYLFTRMLAAVPLKSGDTKTGEEVGAPTRSKSEKSSKKRKSSQSDKKKATSPPESALKKTKDSFAEEKVHPSSLDISLIGVLLMHCSPNMNGVSISCSLKFCRKRSKPLKMPLGRPRSKSVGRKESKRRWARPKLWVRPLKQRLSRNPRKNQFPRGRGVVTKIRTQTVPIPVFVTMLPR